MPIPRLATVEKRMPAIKEFLMARGAEVLATTNPYELLRFRSSHGISVLYKTARGRVTHTGQTQDALLAYFDGRPWSSGNAAKRRKQSGADITAILARDGDGCFLCLEPLGDDITREHLLPITAGGPDHIANKALAHQRCNSAMHPCPSWKRSPCGKRT